MQRAMAAGEPVGPVVVRYNAHLAERAVPEWQATLDALQELPEIGTGGPVGYWGLNMGTAIGVPLAAADHRITAAVFGLFWPDLLAEVARQVTIPVEFDLQWDDQHIDRQAGLALFDAFASKEKTLHAMRARIRSCPGSRPTVQSGSSSGTSAEPAHHRPDPTGTGIRPADDLAALIGHLDPREVTLVAHSADGGEVARYLAPP